MTATELKQKIAQKLNSLDIEQLTLIDNLLSQLTSYLKKTTSPSETNHDPLASLRNSDFIGCFEDDPNLATNSEAIGHEILSRKGE